MNIIKKILFVYLSIFIVFTISSCKTQSQKLDCFNSIIETSKINKDYFSVEKSFKDSITHWAYMKIRLAQGYEHDEYTIDAVIFNNKRNRCFIIILKIDTTIDATLDYVDYALGEKNKDSIWNFYLVGVPSLAITKGNTIKKLSLIGREKLIKGGILNNNGCSINENYINGWFNDDLYKQHIKFLYDTVSTD